MIICIFHVGLLLLYYNQVYDGDNVQNAAT